MTEYRYIKGVTLGPPMALLWRDGAGAVLDLSTGYGTWTVKIVDADDPGTLLATKTANITGYSTAAAATSGYNLLIDWDTADHATLTAAVHPGIKYRVIVIAAPSGLDAFEFRGDAYFVLESAPA